MTTAVCLRELEVRRLPGPMSARLHVATSGEDAALSVRGDHFPSSLVLPVQR